jgi:signal transduction histidine kinase
MNSYDFVLIAGTVLFMLVLGFVVVFFLIHLKKNKEHKKETELLQLTFQKELLKVQLEVQEQTFKDISQELHDNIGQILTLAKLNLNTLDFQNPATLPDKTEDTKQLISSAISNLRDLSRTLNTDAIVVTGLAGAIETELNRIEKTGIVKTKLLISGNRSLMLTPEQELILFRITQESLQNIIKHAGASFITVEITYQPPGLQLSIRDNGKGFNVKDISHEGSGLKNMENRASLIGAKLSVESTAEKGTIVNVVV